MDPSEIDQPFASEVKIEIDVALDPEIAWTSQYTVLGDPQAHSVKLEVKSEPDFDEEPDPGQKLQQLCPDRDQRTLTGHTGQTEVKQELSLHQQPDVGTPVKVKSEPGEAASSAQPVKVEVKPEPCIHNTPGTPWFDVKPEPGETVSSAQLVKVEVKPEPCIHKTPGTPWFDVKPECLEGTSDSKLSDSADDLSDNTDLVSTDETEESCEITIPQTSATSTTSH